MFIISHTSTIKNTSRQTEQTTLRTGSQVTWHFHVKDSLSLLLALNLSNQQPAENRQNQGSFCRPGDG